MLVEKPNPDILWLLEGVIHWPGPEDWERLRQPHPIIFAVVLTFASRRKKGVWGSEAS